MAPRTRENLTVAQHFAAEQAAAVQQYELSMTAAAQGGLKAKMMGPGGADGNYQILNQSDYLRTIAFARVLETSDPAVSTAANRFVELVNPGAFTPEPDTGDPELDEYIQAEIWNPWCSEPTECDQTKRMTFSAMAQVALRRVWIDGDLFVLPDPETGAILNLEGHRVQGPTLGRRSQNRICGVEVDRKSSVVRRYWMTRANVPFNAVVRKDEIDPVDAFNSEGWPNVFHVFNPRMFTLNRGFSALSATGMTANRRNDIEFATMVKAQTASCITFVETMTDPEVYKWLRERQAAPGINSDVGEATSTESFGDWNDEDRDRDLVDIAPGRLVRAKPGHNLAMQTPNIPGEGQLELNMLCLQYQAMNWGIPLVALLLDAKQVSLSAYRGVMDLCYDSVDLVREMFAAFYHRPIYRNLLRIKLQSDRKLKSFRAAENRENPSRPLHLSRLFRGEWNFPARRYYHPVDDATGDLIQLANGMQSLHQYAKRRHGMTGVEFATHLIETNQMIYRLVLQSEQKLRAEFPDAKINPYFLFPWPSISQTSVSLQGEDVQGSSEDSEAGETKTNGASRSRVNRLSIAGGAA